MKMPLDTVVSADFNGADAKGMTVCPGANFRKPVSPLFPYLGDALILPRMDIGYFLLLDYL
jgi:hypothetical protein